MIRVIGWYDRHNIGDESYKLSFRQLFPQEEFDFKGEHSAYDVCILGGGDILHAAANLNRALSVPAKRRIIFSVSATNENTPLELVSRFDQIFVRDKASVKFLTQKGLNCTFVPDAAFILKPDPVSGEKILRDLFAREKRELYDRRVVLVFNAHLLPRIELLARDQNTFFKAVQDMARVMDETSASFILLPMGTDSPYDDRAIHGLLQHHCKFWKKNLVVYDRLSVQDTLSLISAADAAISTRLHTSIFSTVCGVPFLDLVHHDKNRNFLETINWPLRLDYWSLSGNQIQESLERLLGDIDRHRAELQAIYQEQFHTLIQERANVCLS